LVGVVSSGSSRSDLRPSTTCGLGWWAGPVATPRPVVRADGGRAHVGRVLKERPTHPTLGGLGWWVGCRSLSSRRVRNRRPEGGAPAGSCRGWQAARNRRPTGGVSGRLPPVPYATGMRTSTGCKCRVSRREREPLRPGPQRATRSS